MNPLLSVDIETLNSLGIIDWGYTEESKPLSFQKYDEWVTKGLSHPLNYLQDHRKNLRTDLKLVYPEFKSALVFLFSYQPAKKWMIDHEKHQVAGYSMGFGGEDYHSALKRRLELITQRLELVSPNLRSFISLDAQPILERDLALRAGLGWFGKNSMIINQKEGSYFIIGSLLLNQTLQIEKAQVDIDHCGQCNACVEACPTGAIDGETRTLKAEACISTFTIETFKEVDPPAGFEKSRGEYFGCDICQDVCPWNKKPLGRVVADLKLVERFSFLKNWFYIWPVEQLKTLMQNESNRGLRRTLQGTAFDRPGKEGWLKNFKPTKD